MKTVEVLPYEEQISGMPSYAIITSDGRLPRWFDQHKRVYCNQDGNRLNVRVTNAKPWPEKEKMNPK